MCSLSSFVCHVRDTLAQDCDKPHLPDRPEEPSAFGSYNTMSGPFFDPSEEPKHSSTKPRKPSDWERDDIMPDGRGKNAPINVGRQGRRKAKEKLEKQSRILSDEDDWFGNTKKIRSNHMHDRIAPRRRGESSSNPRKPTFTLSFRSDPRSFHVPEPSTRNQNHSRPGLLDRLQRITPDDARYLDSKGRSSKSHRDDERERPRRNEDRDFRGVDDRDSYGMEGRHLRRMDDRNFSRRSDRGDDSRSQQGHDKRKRGLLDRIRDPQGSRIDTRQSQPGPRYKGAYYNSRP
jgi:protein AIR1/2